ncbi:hypothetical protein [uncultured Paraglaciecola sp.]|uniref:hypothetical protein n=1 Tax=uncultured Paraglaciecola sp. TaxID=1765024 RepID=UPI002597088B|nr:hypothetical protein [uncultured Paraglaciecola sp.]
MEITNNALSLFNYIGNNNYASESLDSLASNARKEISNGIGVLESGLNTGAFEETFELIENGEIDIDLNHVENYYQFNQQKLNREVAQLAESFDLETEIVVKVTDDELVVEGDSDNIKALQQYLDKDSRLNALIQQTAKLSEFVEWGEAKNQAAEYKENGMSEESIVAFLQDARSVMNHDNKFVMADIGSTFYSRGYTQSLIDKISEEA